MGDDLAGAKLDAQLMFPGQIKQALTEWRVGFPFALTVPATYTVRSGDTLASIARQFNVSVESLRSLNSLTSDTIAPGRQLTVKSDDRDMVVVQGRTAPGRPLVKLLFDQETGLLVRQIRYTDSPVGRIPTQIDYSDYGVVNGVKIPFKWEVTWTDGRETYQLDPRQIQANVAIPDSRFAKPAAPVPPKPATR